MANTNAYVLPVPTLNWKVAGPSEVGAPSSMVIAWSAQEESPYIPPPLLTSVNVDGVNPVVTWVNPLPGGQISPFTQIVVDITDDTGTFCNFSFTVDFPFARPERSEEAVYTGTRFTRFYRGSTVVSIANGFRFTLQRQDGWPSTPKFEAEPVDAAGNRSLS